MRPILSASLFAAALLTAPASAQTAVYGESPAAACFRDAVAQRSDRAALRNCDEALTSPSLSRRDRAATRSNRGIVQLHRGLLHEALADFDAAEELGLNDQGALGVNRSSAYLRLGRNEEARRHAELAIAADNRHAAYAWYNRGVALEALGEAAAAYESYTRALELRPDWALPARELERFRVRDD